MSGLGRKVFVVLEQLGAAEVNGYLMDQTVMVFATSTARATAIPTPTEGMVTYLKNSNTLEFYDGAWLPLISNFTLNQLADVTITSATTGNSLIWNGTAWVNQTLDLGDAGDVDIVAAVDGDFLRYDTVSGDWVNATASINDLSDVEAASPTAGSSLYFNGLDWIAEIIDVEDLGDVVITDIAEDEILVWDDVEEKWVNDGTTYQKTAEKDQPDGYAGLDGSGKLDPAQIPSLAIGETFVVANEAARLALTTAETGDIAVQTDTSETYILQGTDPAESTDWVKLLFPPDLVDSVNGQTGVVVLELGDIDDVVITSPTEGEILTYDATAGEWYNGEAPSGTLAGLTDVDVTGVADGQTIVYDADNDEWIPGTSGGGFEISATAPPDPTNGNAWFNSETGVSYIYYVDVDGGQWVQIGGGGGGSTEIGPITFNLNEVSENITFEAGYNGVSAGPITIADGVTVTVPDGSAWSIV